MRPKLVDIKYVTTEEEARELIKAGWDIGQMVCAPEGNRFIQTMLLIEYPGEGQDGN